MGTCSYCMKRRAVHRDHVIPKAFYHRLRRVVSFDPALKETVPSCEECNWRKLTRLLVPPSWADRVDALNDLHLGTFRVWDGDPRKLLEVVK